MVKKKNVIVVDDEDDWRYVSGYGERYKVYCDGSVYEVGDDGDQKVEVFLHKNGLWFVTLVWKGNSKTCRSVANIVYESFVRKIKSNEKIKYIDGNKNNLSLDNLETILKVPKIEKYTNDEFNNNCKWEYIDGFNKKYKVTENGDVYEGDKKLKSSIHFRFKIPYVTLIDNNNNKATHGLARLVYETFTKEKVRDGTKLKYLDDDVNNYKLGNLYLF